MMKDWSSRNKKTVCEWATDPTIRLHLAFGWAATLFNAFERPLAEREQLMAISDDLEDLWPPIRREQLGLKPLKPEFQDVVNRKTRMSEGDRLARLLEIETRLQDLCKRNSIALDEPLAAERLASVQRVQAERKRASEPVELALEHVQREQRQLLDSALDGSADWEKYPDELRRLLGEAHHLTVALRRMLFLGVDAVDTCEP